MEINFYAIVNFNVGEQGPKSQGEMLVNFLQKVFQSEEITSVAEARQMIEQKFESNFRPDNDQVEYLQNQIKHNVKPATPKVILPPEPKSLVKSNVSMEEYDEEDDLDEYQRHRHADDEEDEQMDVDEGNSFPGILRGLEKVRSTPLSGSNIEESKG